MSFRVRGSHPRARLTVVAGGVTAALLCSGFALPGPDAVKFGDNLAHGVQAPAPAPAAAAAAQQGSGHAPGGGGAVPPRGHPAGGGSQTAVGTPGFVQARGTELVVNGAQWQFAGYDDYRLTSTSPGWQCGGPLTNADVGAALDEIHNHSGATVVRTWFMQAYGGPGNWSQFDRVLAAAAARGMRIIPVLSDQWASCEPWPPGQVHYRGLSWYQSGYRSVDFGYSLPYRDYAAAIAAHYRGNTTIAFWQMVNEAEALPGWGGSCDDPAANAALRAFADDVAGVVKAADPNHLVSLGTIGTGQCGVSNSSDFINLHSGRIDLCEYHDYFGPGGLPGDQWHGIAARINDCHSINKPIFAGEVGIQASIASNGSSSGPVTASSLQLRANLMQQKLQAQFGMGIAGFLVWQYATGPRTDNYEVQPSDPTEGVMASQAALLARGG